MRGINKSTLPLDCPVFQLPAPVDTICPRAVLLYVFSSLKGMLFSSPFPSIFVCLSQFFSLNRHILFPFLGSTSKSPKLDLFLYFIICNYFHPHKNSHTQF